ncbi:MAG: hypothetical protein ACKVQV_16595, partial [Bacteroidia bacterium]
MKNAKTGILNLSFNNSPRSFIRLIFLLMIFSTSSLMSQVKLTNMPTPNGEVYSIKRVGNVVFIGGDFDSIGGFERRHLCAIDANTGSVLSWNPSPNRYIENIRISDNKLIVCGIYDTIAGVPAKRISVFDINTLNLMPINYLNESIITRSIVVNDGFVYYYAIGFDANGVSIYVGISRIDLNALQVDSNWRWSFQGFPPSGSFGLAFLGNYFYYADESFQNSVGGNTIHQVCRVDKTTLQIDTLWRPISVPSTGDLELLHVYNGKIYIGGSFNDIN